MDKHSSNSNHPTSQNTNTASADPPTPTDERLKATSASNGQSPNEYVFDEVLFTEAFKLFDAKKIGKKRTGPGLVKNVSHTTSTL